MSFETKQHENWVIDAVFSDNRENKYQEFLQESISSIIEQTKNIEDNPLISSERKVSFENLPSINIYPSPKHNNYMSKSQNWVGHVIEINNDEFTAKLEDKNNPTTYELAEFSVEDVSHGDREMLKLGALFYWSVGYANQDGQVLKQSLLRFKRSVDITEAEFDTISNNANEIFNNLTWD